MLSMKIYIIICYLSHNILTYHYNVIKMNNELLNEIYLVKNHLKGTKNYINLMLTDILSIIL